MASRRYTNTHRRHAKDVARSVVSVCLCVCMLGTTDAPIEMPFAEGLTHVGPKNYVLDGVKIGIPIRNREGNNMAM